MFSDKQKKEFFAELERCLDAHRASEIMEKYMTEDKTCEMHIEFKGAIFKQDYREDSEEYKAVVAAANRSNIPLKEFYL